MLIPPIGLATGAVSGVVVLDVDSYKGGADSLSELEQSYQPLPETVQALTGGGGVHYVFAHPGTPVKNGVESLGPGLDIRGDGGYVIAPPSLHRSGKPYAWELQHEPDDTPLAPMPAWLLALCQETRPYATVVEAGAPIMDGARNDTLFRLGCSFRAKGCTEAVILAALRELNATQCQPPITDAEVQKIVGQVVQYAPGPSLAVGPPPAAGASAGVTAPAQAGGAPTVQWGTPGQHVPPPRPDVFLNTEMTRIVDETQAALLALPKAPVIYQRARQLAVIARGVKPPKWLHRPHDMPVILDASHARLAELASQGAQYWKYDKRRKQWESALPPGWVIETLQGRGAWPFPVLEGIVASPTLRPDGSLLDQPGYDASTGLYLDTNGTTFPSLPDAPDIFHARIALKALKAVVKDFPFAEPWHESAALAAVLSLVCRFAIMGNVPLFAIRANTRGSGKSLLADVVSIIGTGRAAPRWPQVAEEDEERKRLLTVALAGYPCLHIDNVTKPLGSPALDLALTAPSFSDRILGKTDSREAPLSMVWLASGNNMMFRGDTARRIVPVDLDPKMEKPEERTKFTHTPLIPWVQQERPRLTVAALTILKAYFEAGCPAQGLTAMGSFEPWSDLIRQALVWAGEADPNEGRKDLEAESDPEYERLAGLLEAWVACYPIAPGTTRSQAHTLYKVMADIAALKMMDKPAVVQGKPNAPNEYDALQDALGAFDARYDGKGLRSGPIGNRLRVIQGRMIDTKRLTTMGKDRTNKALWGIEAF